MNTQPHPFSSETFTLQPLRPDELSSAGEPRLFWLWDGYLAAGKVTTLISPPKSGNTTLLSHLLGGQLDVRRVDHADVVDQGQEVAADHAIAGRGGAGEFEVARTAARIIIARCASSRHQRD
jgi:hypothetical protein